MEGAALLKQLMLQKIISRIQRNHGLEHATIHVLSEKQKNFNAQGNSNHRGFYLNIYGDVSYDTIVECVNEAFNRMKDGEHSLAVHPNCGTVLLTTATMTTIAAQAAFAFEGLRQGKSRNDGSVFVGGLSTAILASVFALITSRPVGLHLQEKYTTDGNLGDMQLVSVKEVKPGPTASLFRALLASNRTQAKSYFVETMN